MVKTGYKRNIGYRFTEARETPDVFWREGVLFEKTEKVGRRQWKTGRKAERRIEWKTMKAEVDRSIER